MSMSLTKSFSLSLNDCKDPGKRRTQNSTCFHLTHVYSTRKSCISVPHSLFSFPFFLLDLSPVDTLSVSSQPDEVCARVLVRIGDHAEVNILNSLNILYCQQL